MRARRITRLLGGVLALALVGAWFTGSTTARAGVGTQAPSLLTLERLAFAPDDLHGFGVGRVSTGISTGMVPLTTADGGRSWAPGSFPSVLPVSEANGLVAIDAAHAWALTEQGAYTTADGGATWVPRPGAFVGQSPIRLSAADASHAWVSGQLCDPKCGGRVSRTATGGLAWSGVVVGPPGALPRAVSFADVDHGFVVGDNGLVARSVDGGKFWSTLTLPAALRAVNFVAASATGANSAVVAGEACGSTCSVTAGATADGGATWTTTTFAGAQASDMAFGDSLHGWIVGRTCDPLSGCSNGIWATADGGHTWTPQTPSLAGFGLQVVAAHSTSAWATGMTSQPCDIPYLMATGGGGTTWTTLIDNSRAVVGASSVSFGSATSGWQIGLSVCEQFRLRHSADGGATWTDQSAPSLLSYANQVAAVDATHAWAGGFDALDATTDGTTWNLQLPLRSQGTVVDAIDASHATVAIQDFGAPTNHFFATADGGATWTSHPLPLIADSLSFPTPSTGWAGVLLCGLTAPNCAEVEATSDGGATWSIESLPGAGFVTGVSFPDTQHGWAVENDGEIEVTSDGGQIWTPQLAPPGVVALDDVHFLDATTGWAVGICAALCSGEAIITTSDGGLVWTRVSSPGTLSEARAVSVLDAAHIWVTGTASCDRSGFFPSAPCRSVLASSDGGQTWTPE